MSNGAREIANDLTEALRALKTCRDLLLKNVLHHGTDVDHTEAIQQAVRVLNKYPNLK
jgi:hypothetical protein